MRTRRNNNKSTYRVKTARGVYAVTLERIRNDVNGNPRYSANVLVLDVFGEEMDANYIFTASYNFGGHYCGEPEEAAYIVGVYEAEL